MKTLLLFILTSLTLTAQAQTPVIQFSPSIPESQKQRILSDLDRLRTLRVDGKNEQANSLFETPSLTTAFLNSWLAERSHYFLEEGFNSQGRVQVLQENFTYPNPIVATFETATKQTGAPDSKVRVVMSNKGVSHYWSGKNNKQKLALDIPGLGSIQIASPHTGIFMIGSALFKNSVSDSVDSMASSLQRLKTYFHEARHSDGNGQTLGFFHVVCPVGHQYAGYSACDKNINGPYQVASQFLSVAVLKGCSDCEDQEKEALRNSQLDSQLRIVNQSLNEQYIPVKFSKKTNLAPPVMSLSSTCQTLNDQGINISQIESCKSGAQVSSSNSGSNEPPRWDPTPESTGDL